ncbi:MAG: YicC/YloC family endoribonuclease [Bacteroidia bacterium]
MIHSMTGYGAGSASSPNYNITVELKSLNNRYLELGLKLSRVYLKYEHQLRSYLSKELERGKVSMFISVEVLNPAKRALNINLPMAKTYLEELRAVQDELGLSGKLDLPYILTLPEIIPTESNDPDPEEWDLIKKATDSALKELLASRAHEGQALQNDLNVRLVAIKEGLEEVKRLAPIRLEKVRERIQTSIDDLRSRKDYDENRFEQELIYYIEKLDVNEEIVRLTQHLEYFQEVLDSPESTGKKLNFIAQEMGREINTIGSKANNAEIQRSVVGMKDELDKIKEQVLNVV